MNLDGLFGWLVVALGATGTVLNIHKRRVCFAIWTVSNGTLAVAHALGGHWPLACQFTLYLGLAVWGWFAWGRQAS